MCVLEGMKGRRTEEGLGGRYLENRLGITACGCTMSSNVSLQMVA